MLAHELRTPLALIRNAVEILRRWGDEQKVKPATEMMQRQVGHMGVSLTTCLNKPRHPSQDRTSKRAGRTGIGRPSRRRSRPPVLRQHGP